MNRIAELRAVARVRQGQVFSQESLAQRVGVSRPTLSSWERGETEPTITQALRVASELGVTLNDLGYELTGAA